MKPLKLFVSLPNNLPCPGSWAYITTSTYVHYNKGQILRPRSSSHFISSLRPGSDFHQIFEFSSLQTKRIRLLLKDLLNS